MIDERSRKILCAVVQSYIESPVPVGSRTITKRVGLNLSPATIRNIMADLEDMGFLSQPHTSAGRVPTDKGYRVYVDGLCEEERPAEVMGIFRDRIERLRSDLGTLLREMTERLSEVSHCIAFASASSSDMVTLNRIQLYRYRGNQIVAVVLTNEGIIKHKVIASDFGLNQKDLSRLSDYLNSEFSGYCLGEIRRLLVKQMSKEKVLYDILISKAISLCKEALRFEQGDIHIAGLAEVLGLPDFSDKVKEVARAIEDKHLILKLLEEISSSEEIKVIIGSENPIMEMRSMSVVVAPYRQGDRSLGRIGVIGAKRMDYKRIMSMLEAAADSITEVISGD